ncbi:SIR2 family protein [Photobacterium leiognathi]|uniref:SIR2 family protein n=1 Tax=Photobacterium leiognathi TaxID=553611 RepID=UPI002981A865|nr:SIR2 family protein [Photobacterium leiognathi]
MAMFEKADRSAKKPSFIIDDSDILLKRMQEGDVVFFTGAGFSKSWNDNYPLGFDLFRIDKETPKMNIFNVADSIHIYQPQREDEIVEKENIKNKLKEQLEYFKMSLNQTHSKNIELIINNFDRHLRLKTKIKDEASNNIDYRYKKECYNYFKEIKFSLDVFKRYPSLIPNHLDKTIIRKMEVEIKNFVKDKFKTLVGEDELNIKSKKDINMDFVVFFKNLYLKNKNTTFISTNYDYIIEKIYYHIDEKIVINRGAIEHRIFDEKAWEKSPISLYKINGGFDVFYKSDSEFYINHDKKKEDPNIIIPSNDQDYSDKYFKNVFIKSANKLREANTLVFIGYSLPDEDNIIKFLIKNFVDTSNTNKEIIIISRDLESAKLIKEKVDIIFPILKGNDAIKIFTKSFNDFIKDCSNL